MTGVGMVGFMVCVNMISPTSGAIKFCFWLLVLNFLLVITIFKSNEAALGVVVWKEPHSWINVLPWCNAAIVPIVVVSILILFVPWRCGFCTEPFLSLVHLFK